MIGHERARVRGLVHSQSRGRALGVRVSSYAFVVTVEEALRRVAGREGRARVEDVGIYWVAKRLVRPTVSEGFHECIEVMLDRDRVCCPGLCLDAG